MTNDYNNYKYELFIIYNRIYTYGFSLAFDDRYSNSKLYCSMAVQKQI